MPGTLASPTKAISPQTQGNWMKGDLKAGDVGSSSILHTMRKSAARLADMREVPSDQIMRAGGWENGAWATSYCSRLPRVYMRMIAGFPKEAGFVRWKRATVHPPAALRQKIWPWVDEPLKRYPGDDKAGREFLRLMDKLRDVFLQDSAVLMAEFPGNALWEHEVFQDPEWRPFADKVLQAESQVEDDVDIAIRNAVPAVAESLSSLSASFRSDVAALRHEVMDGLRTAQDVSERQFTVLNDNLRAVLAAMQHQAAADQGLLILKLNKVSPGLVDSLHQAGISVAASSSVPAAPSSAFPATPSSASPAGPFPATSSSVPAAASSPSHSYGAHLPAASSRHVPFEPMTQSLCSFLHVAHEWLVSTDQRPSISVLEATQGAKWRDGPGDVMRSRFRSRKAIMDWMEGIARDTGMDIWKVARLADGNHTLAPDKIWRLKRGKKPMPGL